MARAEGSLPSPLEGEGKENPLLPHALASSGGAAKRRLEGWAAGLMVRDGASAPPHHEGLPSSTMSATAFPQAVVSALPPRSLVRSVRSPRVRSMAPTIEAA